MKILVTGAGGQLGHAVTDLATQQLHHLVIAADHDRLDVADRDAVLGAVGTLRPDLIVHTAAWTAVDACEDDPERAWRVNALGSRHVAEAARSFDAHLVAVSTDYVFDGASPEPYHEWDRPSPLSIYGRSKLGGEAEVLASAPGATVIRTSWLFGIHGANMVKTVLRLAAEGGPLRFVDDQTGCPTSAEDLAGMILQLGAARRPGLYHVTNQAPTTWFEFARAVLAAAGVGSVAVEPVATRDLYPRRRARRPANSVLDNAALRLSGIDLLPDHRDALARTVKALTA